MDFIIGVSWSQNQIDLIWVIVDRMTKSAHFLLVRTTYSAKDCTKLYLTEIVKLHGALVSIILDYGTPFSSRILKSF